MASPVRRPADPSRRARPPVGLPCALALMLAVATPLTAVGAERPTQSRPAFTVAVLGDGFAEALAEGLRHDLAPSGTRIVAATHPPFGLAADDRLDWPRVVRALLADERLNAAVIMLGADDRQPLRDGADVVDPEDGRWRGLYGDRVAAIVALFRAKGVKLTWVGLPIAADEATAADFVVLNEIARDRATAAGATYVDTWNGFADEAGRFSATGPDANGQMTRLRTADGLDLTRAGAIKLAGFVEADLRAKRAATLAAPTSGTDIVLPSQPDLDSALDIDVNGQVRREAGLPALSPAAAARARTSPVVALTAPPVSPDGHLVQSASDPAPFGGTAGTLAERALVEGQPIPSKPGRIDDFAWPR